METPKNLTTEEALKEELKELVTIGDEDNLDRVVDLIVDLIAERAEDKAEERVDQHEREWDHGRTC